MIEIKAALEMVASQCLPLAPQNFLIDKVAGHVLAENVVSDIDSPPFHKSMMDGFAVRSQDLANAGTRLKIVERVNAGAVPLVEVRPGEATQIMTGAPVPVGADSVVMIEQTAESDDHVTINAAVKQNQNILPKATTMKNGQPVMQAGMFVRAEDIGVLAEAGAANCEVIPRPSLAVIATGDELVDVSEPTPTGSQIRNSNGPMLNSLARYYCSKVFDLGIGEDDAKLLSAKILQGLRHDVLVLSGGVSAGVADLVPGLLKEAGVQEVFHKVRIKPGKPVWFGVLESGAGRTLVFGLPGNPVSSMICFRVFVVPALLRLAGRSVDSVYLEGQLSARHQQRGGRTTYWPSKMSQSGQTRSITPLDWKGSADLRTLAEANCFAVFPGEREQFEVGEPVKVFPMSER